MPRCPLRSWNTAVALQRPLLATLQLRLPRRHVTALFMRFKFPQGFVSNKTTAAAAADPLETLLYQIFVAGEYQIFVAGEPASLQAACA